jgi:hypothetical protein
VWRHSWIVIRHLDEGQWQGRGMERTTGQRGRYVVSGSGIREYWECRTVLLQRRRASAGNLIEWLAEFLRKSTQRETLITESPKMSRLPAKHRADVMDQLDGRGLGVVLTSLLGRPRQHSTSVRWDDGCMHLLGCAEPRHIIRPNIGRYPA